MYLDMKPIVSDGKSVINFNLPMQASDCETLKELFPDVEFVYPIVVCGEVKNMSGYMVLYAEANVKFSTPCARCAEPTESELDLSLEKSIATGDVSRENDDYIFMEDMKLDISMPVFEEILLQMPSKILCREDCRGLCARCGKNLNEGDCDCPKSEGDPRLAILRTLLEK